LKNNIHDNSVKEQIISLLRKGYTRSQLINDFGFAERTVDAAIKEYKKRYGDIPAEAKQANHSEITGLDLPAKLDIKQTIAPEYLIQHLSFVDSDRRQTFIDALLVYEAARRSVMQDVLTLQGLAAAQAQITETQLRVLREAKSESGEVAQKAAERAVMMVGQQVQEIVRQAASAGNPNPMTAMVTQSIQPYFSQAIARIFNMFGGFGQPPVVTTNPLAQPPQGQPGFQQTGGQQASDNEVEEAFKDV
jgi:vacuolar-type H+-ATPase subunit H